MGASVSSRAGWSKMCRNMGNKKAQVLPLPVLAIPIMSFLHIIAGTIWVWMGVGFS